MEQTLDIMKRTLTVMQIFAISQFGCGSGEFRKNLLKRTTKGNHWGCVSEDQRLMPAFYVGISVLLVVTFERV